MKPSLVRAYDIRKTATLSTHPWHHKPHKRPKQRALPRRSDGVQSVIPSRSTEDEAERSTVSREESTTDEEEQGELPTLG